MPLPLSSLSHQCRTVSCFTAYLPAMCVAFLLIACAEEPVYTDKIAPISSVSVSPNSIVVFGHVDVRFNERDLSYEKGWYLNLSPLSSIKSRQEEIVRIELNSNKNFYANIPKKDYAFKLFIYEYWMRINDCVGKVNLFIPPDTSAIYVGNLVFEIKKGKLFGPPSKVILSLKDEYEKAVNQFQMHNPNFKGTVAKNLFHFQNETITCINIDTSPDFFIFPVLI